MHTWAKRGLQSALVTGGLLVLGTGVASADENVNPDSPAGPLDVDVTVPVDIDENAVGTPFGEYNGPEIHKTISTKSVTDPVQSALQSAEQSNSPLSKVSAPVKKATAPVAAAADRISSAAGQQAAATTGRDGATAKQAVPGGDEPLRGNKVDLDITAPIQITGNAIGLGGDAVVNSNETQTYSNNQDTATDGSGKSLSGNAVVLDWALPVQLSGNAIGALGGSGTATGSAHQSVSETGDISTDGSNGVASGNVGAAQFATPVQVTGNAVAGLVGQAESKFDATTEAEAGGTVATDGTDGVIAGNAVAGPLALPLKANGNAISPLGGITSAQSTSSADATAGDTVPGMKDIPTYVDTAGDNSVLSGNIVGPQGAGLGNVAGNAATLIGNATTAGESSSDVKSGGFVSTTADHAAGSGNIVSAPVGAAGEGFANAVGGVGNADAQHKSTTDVMAGDGTYTSGDHSSLSSNTVSTPIGAAPEILGNAVAAVGNAQADAKEEKHITTGAYNGSTANESSGSGNMVQVPVATTPELLGIAGAAAGGATASAQETKVVDSGGPGNTEDDGSALSSNLAAAPISAPLQGFGIAGAALGNAASHASTDTTTKAGGYYHATGVGGSGSGNIVSAPVALPGQLHGIALAGGGNASAAGNNLTDAIAGGDVSSDGHNGSITGNVVHAPVGGALNAFGLAGAVGGNGDAIGTNNVNVESGGDVTTNGDNGSIAGNVVGPQAMPLGQVFGDALSVGGIATGVGQNATNVTTGGDVTTSGEQGSLSGNILDVPASAVAQVFGDAVALGGQATGVGNNMTDTAVGGTTETSGEGLSGLDVQQPVGVLAQVYDVSVELLGNAMTYASNDTTTAIDSMGPQAPLIISGQHLGTNDVPTLPRMDSFGARSADLPGGNLPTGNLPTGELLSTDVPATDMLDNGGFSGDLLGGNLLGGDLLSGAQLTSLPSFGGTSALSQADARSAAPAQVVPTSGLPTGELAQLPEVNSLTTVLPRADGLAGGEMLPTEGNVAGNLPTDAASLDGLNVTPQADLPGSLSVVDGFTSGLSNTPLDVR